MKPLPLSKLHYFFCRNHAVFLSEGWVKEVFFLALQLELSFRRGSGGVSHCFFALGTRKTDTPPMTNTCRVSLVIPNGSCGSSVTNSW